ncbi:MAG: tetratricopeptide repeat protein [Polyangia bacterium]|jgi:tetratricopeptide (TPR) repeat protein|nr:tetratricopeptide repeat protein [Polyangia bacterium]
MKPAWQRASFLAVAILLVSCSVTPGSKMPVKESGHQRTADPPTLARQLRSPPPWAYEEFLLAELAVGMGDREEGGRHFRRALSEDPDSPELRLRLAEIAMQKGSHEEALRLAEEALGVDPAYPRAHLITARLLSERDPARARALLLQVLSLWPGELQAYLLLAPLERRKGGAEAERTVYEKMLEKDPDNLDGLLGLALALGRLGLDAEASKVLRRACNAHPFAVDPWLRLARKMVLVGKWDRAAHWLYLGLEATGDDPSLAEELFRLWLARGRHERARDLVVLLSGHETAATLTQVANLRERLGDDPGAEGALQSALRQDPSFGPALVDLARLWSRRGNTAAARRVLEDQSPGSVLFAFARRELAAQREAAGEWVEAEKVLRGILEAGSADGATAESLAFLQARTGSLQRGLESLERARLARGLLSDDPGHRYSLALLLEEAGQWPRAQRLANAQLDRDPDDAQVLNLLGYGLAERGIELDRALGLLRAALRLDPLNPYFLDSLGWALVKKGRPGEAQPFLERSVLLDRRLCEAWAHLGEARLAAGATESSRAAWEEARACFPGESARAVASGRLRALSGYMRKTIEPWVPRARTRLFE